MQLVPALVYREQAAHGKQQQRDDEAPEIGDLAVAERMFGIGWLLRLPESQVQQHLVAAVRKGVDGLRHHAARMRVDGCRQLGERDAEVRGERVQDRLGRGTVLGHQRAAGAKSGSEIFISVTVPYFAAAARIFAASPISTM